MNEKSVLSVRGGLIVLNACVCLGVMLARRQAYDWLVGSIDLLLPPVIAAVMSRAGLKRGYFLQTVLMAFAFLGGTLGGLAGLYQLAAGFDKLLHTASGAVAVWTAYVLFGLLNGRKRPGREQAPLCALFCFFASMAVAALWEIGEYAFSPLLGRDFQCVAATGVRDTMLDMIVCLIGTLAGLIPIGRALYGRGGGFCALLEAGWERD